MSQASLASIPTPAFLVDRSRLQRNCDRMRGKATASSVSFRPHVKTHKTLEIARIQHGGGTGPITVSTLAEARFFAAGGFRDITYAFPITPQKLPEAAELAGGGVTLNLLFDHVDAVNAAEEFSRANGVPFDAYIKIDCGYHRAGIAPDSAMMRTITDVLRAAAGVRLRGVLTHAGHAYHAAGSEGIRRIAHDEGRAVTIAAEFLRERGFGSVVRSVGSTPTAAVVERFSDCDEVRPGNYVFFDRYQEQLGSCDRDDVAVSVLATVAGVYDEQRKVIIDAGTLAMSRETPFTSGDASYGDVTSVSGERLPYEFRTMSQEHGQLFATGDTRLRIGDRIRLVPNHSCITAAMFDRYYVVDGDRVVDEWRPARGW